MVLAGFQQELEKAGVSVEPLRGDAQGWDLLARSGGYLPVDYSLGWVRYQSAYMAQSVAEYQACPVIIRHGDRSVGLWPVGIHRLESGAWTLGSNSEALLPPWFADGVGGRVQKDITKRCVAAVQAFLSSHADQAVEIGTAAPWQAVENETWVRAWLEAGSTTSNEFHLLVDLSLDLAQIHSHLRRRYRSYVNQGRRLWTVGIHEGQDSAPFLEAFRELHVQAAGRVTRGPETWTRQAEAILAREALLIDLRDASGALVGGGFFHYTRSEAFYGVGAYDRSLFDKPLGHLVQVAAIETFKTKGVRWYRVGTRRYPGESPPPSQKELQIAYFEEGFATHMLPRVAITWPPGTEAPRPAR